MGKSQKMTIEYYKSNDLDRRAHLREDSDWIREKLIHTESLILPVWRNESYVTSLDDPHPAFIKFVNHSDLFEIAQQTVFLGHKHGQAVFAIGLDDTIEPSLPNLGEFTDLRTVGRQMEQEEGALLAYARGLIHWHKTHLFCGACGSMTDSKSSGHMRACSNADCARLHYPRTDPAVIMAIHDGADHLLLGRHPAWPAGNHSVLAGFVEPGESLEQAVAREVWEEVGLEAHEITYRYSQPWPFPSSIMLGFFATADRWQKLTIAEDEIEKARWYSRDELLNSPEDDNFRLPRHDSVARRLVNEWLKVSK